MLVGNRSLVNKSPGRHLSGTPGTLRSTLTKPGMMRNAAFSRLAARPNGHLAPSAWELPKTGGNMSSHGECVLSIEASGEGALGRNMVGSATITINSTAIGGLIAGGVGVATISISGTGAIVATIGSTGSATITIGGVADPGALGWLVGQSTIDITGTLVAYAIGHMSGTTEDQGLSVAGITNAVWNKIVESGFSAQEILRLLAAHAAGDATGLESGSTEFVGLDGTTVRIEGAVAGGNRTITARDVS